MATINGDYKIALAALIYPDAVPVITPIEALITG
jgi:hypothetical protein